MELEEEDLIRKILSRIGNEVSFQYPGNEGQKNGRLKDRVVMASIPGSTGIPYWDVVDLIEFPGEQEPLWMRVGYYRKPKDHLVWGSQTTITEPITIWKNLFIQAARDKPWFRKLLDDVMKEL
jgi:hypothetical protein